MTDYDELRDALRRALDQEPLIVHAIRRDMLRQPDDEGRDLNFIPATKGHGACGCSGDVIVHWVDHLRALLDDDEGYPCGHATTQRGCGGCDPGAVEWVRDDDGPWRRPDPDETTLAVQGWPYTGELPIHRTEANHGIACATCDGSGCYDCTDPAQ